MLAPLRVALEVRSLDDGGLEAVVASLARGLAAHGITGVVICTERGGAQAEQLRREGHEVEILAENEPAAQMRELLRRLDVHLLNAHYSTLGTEIAHQLGIPVVMTLHNSYAWVGNGVLDEMRTLDEAVACYVAVSESAAAFCAERFQIDRERIAVIRNGTTPPRDPADASERRRLRAELGIDEATELVVQIASINRVKCQLAVVDAVALLRDERPSLVAWLVGRESESDYAETVRRRIDEEGLRGRVVLTGPRSDVDRLLGAADVFVMPSLFEGLSLAVLEALQAGVPAVLSDTGDAAFLLGASPEATEAPGNMPGELVQGPAIDPRTVTWITLRELAGAERPPHAPSVARALRTVLDDLEPRRQRARTRANELRSLLTVDAMCDATARLLLRVAATHAAHRARELATDLQTERQTRADVVDRVSQGIESIRSDTRELRSDLAATRQSMAESADRQRRILDVVTEILGKLRITHRARQALQSLWGRAP